MINEITTIEDIQNLVREGFTDWKQFGDVSVKRKDNLLIFNYQSLAINWNFFERVSRGLIVDTDTGEIVARPFDKFFNWGENGQKTKGDIVHVSEKMDGSLGILYRRNGEYKIATRGSFDSEQAQWATKYLNAHYDLTLLPDNWTLLFEIVYPENRIVVDYSGREDLVLLAIRERHTGRELSPSMVKAVASIYRFNLPKTYSFSEVADLIQSTKSLSGNEEGYVVLFSDGTRWKFKGERYLELHRLVSGLTFQNALKAVENGSIDQILSVVPDEFLVEVKEWIAMIQARIDKVNGDVQEAYYDAPKETRKEYALWVKNRVPHLQAYMFAKLDGKDIRPIIFKTEAWEVKEHDHTN